MTQVSARAEAAPRETRIEAPKDTVFFVPDIDFDKKVIDKYLQRKYVGLAKDFVQSQINHQVFAHVPEMRIIVLTRRQKDEFTPLGPQSEVRYNQFKNANEHIPIAPETYIDEVYESPPIRVGDFVKIRPGQLFRPMESDISPLVEELNKHALPNRITPQAKPDFMLRFVWGG